MDKLQFLVLILGRSGRIYRSVPASISASSSLTQRSSDVKLPSDSDDSKAGVELRWPAGIPVHNPIHSYLQFNVCIELLFIKRTGQVWAPVISFK